MIRRPATAAFVAVFTCLALLFSTVTPALAATLDEVVESLNATRVYVEEGGDADPAALEASVQRAVDAGINAYAVVLSSDGDGIKSKDIQAALGDNATVLLYAPTFYDFESLDVCGERFDEARSKADTEITSGRSDAGVDAFITALIDTPEDASCEVAAADADDSGGSSWWQWLLVLLAALLLIALLWTLLRVIMNGRAKAREAEEFEERRRILTDWAGTLRAPVTELQPHVAAAKSSSLAAMYNDALKVARESQGHLESATSLPDLDAAEIRIARAQMQIRDVRKGLLRD